MDHYPTKEELAVLYTQNSSRDISVTSADSTPSSGQKKITIVTKTGTHKNAGTDKRYCFVKPMWDSWTENFIIDDPNKNDLEKGQYDVFYFVINVPASSDILNSAQIGNTSTDGWYCEFIDIIENNSAGEARSNRFYFGQWVDNTANITDYSTSINATNRTSLSY